MNFCCFCFNKKKETVPDGVTEPEVKIQQQNEGKRPINIKKNSSNGTASQNYSFLEQAKGVGAGAAEAAEQVKVIGAGAAAQVKAIGVGAAENICVNHLMRRRNLNGGRNHRKFVERDIHSNKCICASTRSRTTKYIHASTTNRRTKYINAHTRNLATKYVNAHTRNLATKYINAKPIFITKRKHNQLKRKGRTRVFHLFVSSTRVPASASERSVQRQPSKKPAIAT
ncbi:hypothetical protein Bca52824_057164 [Brassica carinata]|uniref:Uncharacterized protein n=1 Tax=Brassica carinata TaxID=52824 RepID=A0A8X7QQ00_BRACI|nr:hypothetical protein Bca52824_057164 [Brassica carinata]